MLELLARSFGLFKSKLPEITLPETIIELEYSLFVEENSLARGHVPLPCLLDGG